MALSALAVENLTRRRVLNTRGVLNAMLVFVPLAVISDWMGLSGAFVFTCAGLACVPLSYWLGQSTEALGTRLRSVSGGPLNATFGNAAELIISIFALRQGLFVVVRTALIGSILGQLLLVLGTSLLLAGFKHGTLRFSRPLVQVNFTLMVIALAAIGLPSILLAASSEETLAGASALTPILSVMLIVIYGLAVIFSLRGQPHEDDDGSGPSWKVSKAMLILVGSTSGIIMVSELLVGSVAPLIEETDVSEVFLGLILIPIFSNVVDHIVAITVALKNKMDLSLTISVGSAAQVACLVLPIIVLVSYAMGQPVGLIFEPIELVALGLGLAMMVPVLLDGSSNWMEGTQLLTCYVILATVLWAF